MNVEDELKNEIKTGVRLKKVNDEEMKAREMEKKKRFEELKKVEEMLAKQGK